MWQKTDTDPYAGIARGEQLETDTSRTGFVNDRNTRACPTEPNPLVTRCQGSSPIRTSTPT